MNYKSLFKFLILAGIAIEPMFEGAGMFGKWEGGTSRLVAALKTAEPSRVAIVSIDRCNDLRTTDSPSSGGRNLARIVAAVTASGAKRIGIDIDTSGASYAGIAPRNSAPPIVWGWAADYSHVAGGFFPRGRPLGNADVSSPQGPLFGLTIVITDGDELVRRYSPNYKSYLRAGDREQALQSFPAAVANTPDSTDESQVLIDFRRRDPSRIVCRASELLDSGAQDCLKKLKDKIVLIGASCDARDEHDTPLGWEEGVSIMADAVDTELKIHDHYRFAAPSRWFTLSWTSLIAALSWLLYRPRKKAVYYFVISFVLAGCILLAAWTAYGSVVNFLFFVPAVAAVSYEPISKVFKKRFRVWRHRLLPAAVKDHAAKTRDIHATTVDPPTR